MEKIISSEPTTQTKVEKANTKFYRWRYGTVEGQILAKPVTNGKNCQYQKWREENCVYCYTLRC